MVNRTFLIGNLGKDSELKRLENGTTVVKFSIATNENYKDKNGEWQTLTEWHDVVGWRDLAERAAGSLKKGNLVYVEGKLTHRTWEDENGNKKYITEVVASYFRNLTAKDNSSNSDPGPVERRAKQKEEPEPVQDPATGDDDLPF